MKSSWQKCCQILGLQSQLHLLYWMLNDFQIIKESSRYYWEIFIKGQFLYFQTPMNPHPDIWWPLPLISNLVKKLLYKLFPQFGHRLSEEELQLIGKIFFLVHSHIFLLGKWNNQKNLWIYLCDCVRKWKRYFIKVLAPGVSLQVLHC